MLAIAFDGNNVDGFGLVGVYVDDKSEICGQVSADLAPFVAGVVAAHHIPMFLHEEHVGTGGVQGNAVNAVSDLGSRISNILRAQPLVETHQACASIVS